MLHQILIFAVMLITIGWQSVSAAGGSLTVAWVENGDLMVWHTGDTTPEKIASDDVQLAFIAPDGEHIAFTRGTDHRSESLWAVDAAGKSEKQLAAPDILAGSMIAQLTWSDASTVYFNTTQVTDVGQVLNDDFWRVTLPDKKAERLFEPSSGGNFSFSPDGQIITLARPGVYDGEEGLISLISPSTLEKQDVLNFPAVGTGSEYRFYPSIFWESDSSSFLVAIPDKDLIYDDSTANTTLLRLSTDGSQEQVGTLKASFFGQPQWSFDGQFIVYMRRVGDAADNQFELLSASGDGTQEAVYTTGEAGTLQLIGWLPNSHQFLYAQGDESSYWLGAPGESPQAIPGKIFAPQFVTESLYIYIDLSANPLELRYADLQTANGSTLITTLDTPISQFSAVFSP